LYRQANDLRLRRPYHVLWLLKRGFTYDQTAIEAGLARANVQKVVSWYRTEGLQRTEKHPRGGTRPVRFCAAQQVDGMEKQTRVDARPRKTRLTPEQTIALEEECRTGKFLHSGQIAQWLWLTFRVVISD
jgi:transposase